MVALFYCSLSVEQKDLFERFSGRGGGGKRAHGGLPK